MDELGYVVEALLILNLAKGNLDDVVAHACERGGALGIGEARGFAVVGGAALAFKDDTHAVGGAFDEDIGVAAGFVIQRARGVAEWDAHVVCDVDAHAALVAGERDKHGGLYFEGRGGLSCHAFGGPAELLNTAQACGLLGERGDIRCGKKRRALPQVGILAVDVDNPLPAAVGWNELKRNSFIKLPLRSFAGCIHSKRAAHLITRHKQLVA